MHSLNIPEGCAARTNPTRTPLCEKIFDFFYFRISFNAFAANDTLFDDEMRYRYIMCLSPFILLFCSAITFKPCSAPTVFFIAINFPSSALRWRVPRQMTDFNGSALITFFHSFNDLLCFGCHSGKCFHKVLLAKVHYSVWIRLQDILVIFLSLCGISRTWEFVTYQESYAMLWINCFKTHFIRIHKMKFISSAYSLP